MVFASYSAHILLKLMPQKVIAVHACRSLEKQINPVQGYPAMQCLQKPESLEWFTINEHVIQWNSLQHGIGFWTSAVNLLLELLFTLVRVNCTYEDSKRLCGTVIYIIVTVWPHVYITIGLLGLSCCCCMMATSMSLSFLLLPFLWTVASCMMRSDFTSYPARNRT